MLGIRISSLGLSMLAAVLGVALSSADAIAARLTTLYHFTDGTDGEEPLGGLVQDATGILYGTTSSRGDPSCHKDCHDAGTFFSFDRAAGLNTLIHFTGPNGAGPANTLLLSGNTLYGNTSGGGASNDGVIFSVHTDGSGFTLLHQFNGADGMIPAGTPHLGAGKILYGVTEFGGPNGVGVLFSIKPDGTYAILHAFTGGADGSKPNSLLIAPNGTLYGATFDGGDPTCGSMIGCGVVFSYTPASGKYTVQYSFNSNTGYSPILGSIGPGPTIYGTTPIYNPGVAENDVFALTAGTLQTVAKLTYGASGVQYPGPTLAANGSLVLTVGQSNYGGDGSLVGIKAGVIYGLAGFSGNYQGGGPSGQPIVSITGSIIGTTSFNGVCYSCGTIYEVVP